MSDYNTGALHGSNRGPKRTHSNAIIQNGPGPCGAEVADRIERTPGNAGGDTTGAEDAADGALGGDGRRHLHTAGLQGDSQLGRVISGGRGSGDKAGGGGEDCEDGGGAHFGFESVWIVCLE